MCRGTQNRTGKWWLMRPPSYHYSIPHIGRGIIRPPTKKKGGDPLYLGVNVDTISTQFNQIWGERPLEYRHSKLLRSRFPHNALTKSSKYPRLLSKSRFLCTVARAHKTTNIKLIGLWGPGCNPK